MRIDIKISSHNQGKVAYISPLSLNCEQFQEFIQSPAARLISFLIALIRLSAESEAYELPGLVLYVYTLSRHYCECALHVLSPQQSLR